MVNEDAPHSHTGNEGALCGGPKGIRTLDLFNAIEALSQLSYRPVTNMQVRKGILALQGACVNIKHKRFFRVCT